MENWIVISTGYTAVIRQDGLWWIGWIEEVRGVNSQGETREELISNLREALSEAIEMNPYALQAGTFAVTNMPAPH